MPAYPTVFAGTPVTWRNTGGTYALTLTSLGNVSARQGGKGDVYHATYGLPAYLDVYWQTAVNVTVAANGNAAELHFGQSDSATAGTGNPGTSAGALTGADASAGDIRALLNLVGVMPFQTALTTLIHQRTFVFVPRKRYIIPYVWNGTGQILHATAGHHTLTVTPYYFMV